MTEKPEHLYKGEGGKDEKKAFEARYGEEGGKKHKGCVHSSKGAKYAEKADEQR